MELRSLGGFALRLGPHSSLIFLTPSLGISRVYVGAGNSFNSVFFNLISSQRSALSTCGLFLQAPAATTVPPSTPKSSPPRERPPTLINESSLEAPVTTEAPSRTPESNSNESPPRKPLSYWVRHMNRDNELSLLLDETGIMKGPVRRITSVERSRKSHSSDRGHSSDRVHSSDRGHSSDSGHSSDRGHSSDSESSPLSSADIVNASFARSLQGGIHGQMILPGQARSKNADDETSSPNYYNAGAPSNKTFRPRAVRTIKSSPRVGRTFEVNAKKGVDVAQALRKLGSACAQNNVRLDQTRQRFYERPGLKRKRLKSQRWRVRFKQGFKALVIKVKVMRRKGW